MGQKINPNILRLGKTKEWKSKYSEKKTNELTNYSFNDLEIQKFINKFLNQNNLIVDNCKLSQSENFLHIFISYFSLPKIKQLISQANNYENIKFRLKKKKKSFKFLKKKANLRKKIWFYNFYNTKYYKKIYNYSHLYKSTNKIKNDYLNNKQFRRLNTINYYKIYQNIKTHKNLTTIKAYIFVKKIIESLYLFMNKKVTILLSLKQLNKNQKVCKTFSEKKKKWVKTILVKLRKFKKNDFFEPGIWWLYNSIISTESSKLIAKYVALYLKVLKRHNFFLNFVKNTLKILLKKKFSNKKKIKILIKGRFNGAPRARKRIYLIGGAPSSLTLNININYSEFISFTPNGTFGIKVWTYF